MREKTFTSLTGVHFRYIKAYALSPKLVDFEATISHIPFCTGYSPLE